MLVYWSLITQPPPLPVFTEPDEEGYAIWQDGTPTPLVIPTLTDVNMSGMNQAGDIWGSSDQGAFVYRSGNPTILDEGSVDVTIITGVDGGGRVYGILGNYPEGVDPEGLLVPIEPTGSFMWENGAFSELDLLLADSLALGVLQDGTLWGSNQEASFIQQSLDLTVIDHPSFDYTGFHGLTAELEAYGFALTSEPFASETYFWSESTGFEPLPSGWELPGTNLSPNAMNEAGVFWGWGGANTAFVATPIPEPSTALLLSLGVALALRRRAGKLSRRCRYSMPQDC